MQATEAITSIRRVEEQIRLSNPNDFLEKLITIAPVLPDSASLVRACIWFDFSAVQSPLSHQSGNLPSYQFLQEQPHWVWREGTGWAGDRNSPISL